MGQLEGLVDGMAGRDHTDIHLPLPRQTYPGDEASPEVDHPSVDARQMGVRIEHEISVGEDTPKHIRLDEGLTAQLAKATGMTQRAISYYEIEAEFPPAPALTTLAQTLEVSTDELLGVQPPTPAGREQPQQQRLWKRFQKMEALPTKDQRAVIRLINSLAGTGQTHAEAS